jgi:hypothetical protein
VIKRRTPRRAAGSGFVRAGIEGSGCDVRGTRVWARLLDLQRAVVEDGRIGTEKLSQNLRR